MTVEDYLAQPTSVRSGNPMDHDPIFPGPDDGQLELVFAPAGTVHTNPFIGKTYPGCYDAEDNDPYNNKRG